MSNIIRDFKTSAFSDEVINLAKDYTELAIDSILDEGIFKEIPIIGSVVSLYKMGSAIKELQLIRKIASFLTKLDGIPQADKDKFLARLNSEDPASEIFEKLLFLLDRLDEVMKAEIIGNLFRIYIMDGIDKPMFLRLSSIIEHAILGDLISFYLQYHGFSGHRSKIDERFIDFDNRRYANLIDLNLANLGLLKTKISIKKEKSNSLEYGIKTQLELSSAGRTLSTFMFYELGEPTFIKHLQMLIKENLEMKELYGRHPINRSR
ncbi:hypothetical protein [Pedobacter suwonensis]|uniref:hypothetical protein n=1 Tax=Pedobacter suwonensis TaxID=332999 RepID=UPI0011A79F26|nr:hypothetical protein [Pedobacter suwonensis]